MIYNVDILRKMDADINLKPLKMFYDETNNVRKLYLKEGGLNIPKNENFVLGGIAMNHSQYINSEEFSSLRKSLGIQDNSPEIKFSMISSGDFDKLIGGEKLGRLLTWLLEKNVLIHCCNINLLYWSIVDIVDGLASADPRPMTRKDLDDVKNVFYKVVISNQQEFLDLLWRFEFPGVEPSNTARFLNEVISFIQRNFVSDYNNFESSFHASSLLAIIYEGSIRSETSIINSGEPMKLIRGFSDFYIFSIIRSSASLHTFDEEKVVQESLSKRKIVSKGVEIKPVFVDSKKHPEVQLSDCIAGMLGKLFTYIENTSMEILAERRRSGAGRERENIDKIATLIQKSHLFSSALFHRVSSLEVKDREEAFLFNGKSIYNFKNSSA